MDDGQRRIHLGDLVVANAGASLRFEPVVEPAPARADWYTRNLNAEEKEVDFGFVRTSGSVRLDRVGEEWRRTDFPSAGK